MNMPKFVKYVDTLAMEQPIGFFIHHQGQGHIDRCSAIIHALPSYRSIVVFCAKPEKLPVLPDHVEIIAIDSLFERSGNEVDIIADCPDIFHCAPLGWPGIRHSMGTIARWFAEHNPALIISDVSAEIAHLARLCSVPHINVVQHGDRNDTGHLSAYTSAVGLLAPFSYKLAQTDWSTDHRNKMFFAPGLGVTEQRINQLTARNQLNICDKKKVLVVITGSGGSGFSTAPIGVGAQTLTDWEIHVIGNIQSNWHATLPANIRLHGWVDHPEHYIAAADIIISTAGNTVCSQILKYQRPWIVIPEWTYFDEQLYKASQLGHLGVATYVTHLPSYRDQWLKTIHETLENFKPTLQSTLFDANAAVQTANWIESLIEKTWNTLPQRTVSQ